MLIILISLLQRSLLPARRFPLPIIGLIQCIVMASGRLNGECLILIRKGLFEFGDGGGVNGARHSPILLDHLNNNVYNAIDAIIRNEDIT